MSEFINAAENLFARESAIKEEISQHPEGDVLHELFCVALKNVQGDMQQLLESDIEGGELVRFTHNSYAAAIVAVNETVERGWINEEQSKGQIDRLIEEAKSDNETWRNIKIAKRLMNISGVFVDADSTDTTDSISFSDTEITNNISTSEDTETFKDRTEVNIGFDYESGYVTIGDRRMLLNRTHTTEELVTHQRARLLESIAKWNNEVEPGTKITPKEWWALTFGDQDYDRSMVSNLYNWMQSNLTFRRQKIIDHTGLRGRGSKYISGNYMINLDFDNKPVSPVAETNGAQAINAGDTSDESSTEIETETRKPQSFFRITTGYIPDIERMAERRSRIRTLTRGEKTVRHPEELHEGYSGINSWRLASGLPPAPILATGINIPTSCSFEEYSPDEVDFSDKEWEMIESGEKLIDDVFSELAVYFRTGTDEERIKTDRLYHLKPYSSQSLGRASEKGWISRDVLGINLREAMRLSLLFDTSFMNLYGIKRNKKVLETLISWKIEDFTEQKQQQQETNYI